MRTSEARSGAKQRAALGNSAVFGSFVASVEGVAEEARTRSFAAPAFAGCAFIVGLANLSYGVVRGLSSDERARLDTGFLG
jgi:hypothetical protein